MILFLGDSYTWGQGLQYIHLVESKGWTWKQCENIVPPNANMEWLGLDEDEFRKKNSFPYLVAQKLDIPFSVGRFENGGDNQTTYQMLQSINPFISTNNIFCIIVQFSEPSRSLAHEYDESLGTIEEQIKLQVSRIDSYCKKTNIDWLGISWQPEIGEILKSEYSENYVPIMYNEKEFTNFSTRYSELSNMFLKNTYPINDEHFNLDGHKLIAESILNKIYSTKYLIDKLIKYKTEVDKIRKL